MILIYDKVMKHYTYVASLLLVFTIPALVQAYFLHNRISLPHLLIFAAIVTILGTLYDIWATRHGGRDPIWLWQFNPKDTLGIKLFDLPIEEYLFFAITSCYCVLSWEGINYALEARGGAIYYAVPVLGLWTLAAVAVMALAGPKLKVSQ